MSTVSNGFAFLEKSSKELEEGVNDEITKFEAFFQGLGNDGLNKFEHSIVKTYLRWKSLGSPEKHNA